MTDNPRAHPRRVPDVVGDAEVLIRTTATEVLDFILDVERYRTVDPKIGTIHWIRRSPDGREVTFRFTPQLGPLPAVVRSTQRVTRVGDHAVSIAALPSWVDRLAQFHGSLSTAPAQEGVLVRRRLEFWLAAPLRPTLGPVLRRWLARDVPAELAAVRQTLEANA